MKEINEKLQGIPWKEVDEYSDDGCPPKGKQLLALSPDGIVHVCCWREMYSVFDVQNKMESSDGWWWSEINYPPNKGV